MPSSRPMPDSFMPPKGHWGVAGTGSLMPMIPASRPSAIRVATVRSLVEPRRGEADLAVVAELAQDGRLRHLLDVGVGEDDQRGVAAEFQAEPLDLVGGAADQLLADPGRAGEADLADGRVGEQGVGELD